MKSYFTCIKLFLVDHALIEPILLPGIKASHPYFNAFPLQAEVHLLEEPDSEALNCFKATRKEKSKRETQSWRKLSL